jgi:hypothetical protein
MSFLLPRSELEHGGDRGNDTPTFGVGDKVSYIPQYFHGTKCNFNAFSVLGCFYKKLQQILERDVEKKYCPHQLQRQVSANVCKTFVSPPVHPKIETTCNEFRPVDNAV